MYRNICFTVNNYTEEERLRILNDPHFSYVVIGKEIAPDTGTPHLQGYGELVKRMRHAAVEKIFRKRAWFKPRMGDQEEAQCYAAEDGDWEDRGELREQGHRSDLDRVRNDAIDVGMRGVTRYANRQQIGVAEKFLTYNEEPRDWKPEVWWLHGPTGVGKSRRAREITGTDDTYIKNEPSKWWDGYDGHENVILDDYRPDWAGGFVYLLGLLDRYEFKVEIKGGFRQMRAFRIIVTCPWSPRIAFATERERLDQLERRIDHVVEFVPEVAPVPEVARVIIDLANL